jgi:hydrogenase/urease accessory protein HupE
VGVVVDSRLFHETNPWHKDFCSLAWNEDEPVPHTFEGSSTRWVFEPAHVRRPGVLATFVHLGITHILGTPAHPLAGSDHLAFLLALLVASRRARTLVGVVTAFTLAHSLTLAAAALGWVHVPQRFVELAIALSIAYVACDNLLRREARDPWLEAFLFGLLHGLGFAGFLSDALTDEPLILTALVGFNVGVELGQLAFVLACVLVIALVFRAHRRSAEAGLVPPRVRTAVSVLVAACGFYWFLERAGWLPWA